jgi:hypothetical protein
MIEKQREMTFQNFDAEKGTLTYGCPARQYGYECRGATKCTYAGAI